MRSPLSLTSLPRVTLKSCFASASGTIFTTLFPSIAEKPCMRSADSKIG
ncbi:MAG: hypothetical protein H6R08_732 [Proteobacteria bacterium]|nr:hypothetical protein [Pseudomonadota bacterium]